MSTTPATGLSQELKVVSSLTVSATRSAGSPNATPLQNATNPTLPSLVKGMAQLETICTCRFDGLHNKRILFHLRECSHLIFKAYSGFFTTNRDDFNMFLLNNSNKNFMRFNVLSKTESKTLLLKAHPSSVPLPNLYHSLCGQTSSHLLSLLPAAATCPSDVLRSTCHFLEVAILR